MKIKRFFVGELYTNCYIIESEDEICVIDPGDDVEQILKYTGDKRISKIILTHGHFDHIMGADEIRKKSGAKIYISREDASMLKDSKRNLYNEFNKGDNGFLPIEQYCFLDDKIDICGNEFEVMKTPGHSEGSVCLYFDKDLFSGDTLFKGTIGRCDYGDFEKMKESLKKLMLLDDDVKVYPGHGFSTTIGKERAENPFILEINEN